MAGSGVTSQPIGKAARALSPRSAQANAHLRSRMRRGAFAELALAGQLRGEIDPSFEMMKEAIHTLPRGALRRPVL